MSELARKLIAENKRTRAANLDLGNCGLTELPDEVGELEWLEELSFAGKWWEWDGQAWQRKESQNRGENNELRTGIGPLRRLTRLRSVSLD